MKAGIVLCAASLLAFVPERPAQADQQVRIISTAPLVNARSKPEDGAPVAFQAKAGEVFRLVSNQGDWIEVVSTSGQRGFIFHTLGEVSQAPVSTPGQAAPKPPPAPEATSGPSIDHEPIDCIVAGKFPKLNAGFQPPDVARARVYFKIHGGPHWYYVNMTTEEGRFVGVLPKPKKSTKMIDYYVDGLDKASLEGRTKDYTPEVVEKSSQCKKKLVAATVPNANVIVGAEVGALAAPLGFEAVGAVAAVGGASTALVVGGAAAAAGGAIAIAKGSSSSGSTCKPNGTGFKFSISYAFSGGPIACSATNTTQQTYTIVNNTCSTIHVQSLSVGYQFSGQCGTPNSTTNLALNGNAAIPANQSAVIRTGAAAGSARTFCCPKPPCADSDCSVVELFTVNTDQGTQTATNTFTVQDRMNDCPQTCTSSHADFFSALAKGLRPTMCFEGYAGP